MRESILYDKLEGGRVQCQVCYRMCVIDRNERGYCLSRMNLGGTLYSLIYGIISAMERTPIEDKPLIHFHPGTRCLSIGTFGCNFRCQGCQNHDISWGETELDTLADRARELAPDRLSEPLHTGNGLRYLEPDEVVVRAQKLKCQGVAFTYNEPTIWIEYVLDVARLAKEAGLYTVHVTNSWLTPAHLDLIGPYIDAMALDIKSLDPGYYSKHCDVPSAVKGVLQTCAYAASRHDVHVETRTCVVPGLSDDPETLSGIAEWIRDNLGKENVWHLLRFFPKHRLSHYPATPLETLSKGKQQGEKAGLEYVSIVADKGCD